MGKICCFTGHREIKRKCAREIYAYLCEDIEMLISDGYDRFRVGGAIGFDTMAALAVLEAKKEHPHIKLDLVLPCKDQDKFWRKTEKIIYSYIKNNADTVNYVSERYHSGVMMQRNRKLVDGSDFCIAFVQKRGGGSAYTGNYAKEKGIPVLNIAGQIKKA